MTSNILDINNSLLLVVDLQEKLLRAQPKSRKIVERAAILCEAARALEIPTVVTEQYPKGLGETTPDLKIKLDLSTKFFEKTAFSCFQEEGFAETLKASGKKQIIICGIEAHVCVCQTVNDLLHAGYEVHLVQDAIGSRDKYEYKKGVARMIQDGAVSTCVEMVIFELLKTSKHPKFKEVQSLIK